MIISWRWKDFNLWPYGYDPARF